MILNETTESGWNWKQNSLISVKDADGRIKIIVQNDADSEEAYRLKFKGEESVFLLPANSICAIVIQKT